jgi:WD40 repeat protein
MRLVRRHYGKLAAAVLLAAALAVLWWALPVRPRVATVVGDRCELLHYSGDGRTVMTRDVEGQEARSSGPVRIWDTMTGRLRASFLSPAHVIGQAAICCDGQRIALEHYDSPDSRHPLITLFDVTTQQPIVSLHHTESEEEGEPDAQLVFSPDGKWLAVVRYDRSLKQMALRLVDTSTGRVEATLPMRDHEYVYCLVRFSPNGSILAYTTAIEGRTTLRLYALPELRERAALAGEYYPLAFSPDGRLLATAPAINGGPKRPLVISVRDACTGQTRGSFAICDGFKLDASFTTDGKTLIAMADAGYGECQTILWDIDAGTVLSVFKGRGTMVKKSGDGSQSDALQYITVILQPDSETGNIRYLDPLTGKARQLPYSSGRLVFADCWTLGRDGRAFAVEDLGDTIQNEPWWHRFADYLPFKPNQDTVFIRCVRLWDVSTGRDLGIFPRNSTISPTGDTFAVVHERCLRIWDLPPRKPLGWFLGLAGLLLVLTLGGFWWQARRRKRQAALATEAIPCGT